MTEPVPWSMFETAMPELAAFGRERLTAQTAYLATVRHDALPRVYPVTPSLLGGHLCIFMSASSPKAQDVIIDGRIALHAGVEDDNGGKGEFLVRGRGRVVPPAELDGFAGLGFPRVEGLDLYELLVLHVAATTYTEGQAVRRAWRPS